MKKLWQKNNSISNRQVEQFLSSEDLMLDYNLVQWDIYGTLAHILMLKEIGILSINEHLKIKKELLKMLVLHNSNKFVLNDKDEDVHTKIETDITIKLGNIGKKMHTARSRNDQIALDIRLYAKDQLFSICNQLLEISEVLFGLAKKNESIPMPGYTHMQKAMPSSVGMWFASYAESMIDNIQILKSILTVIDQSPLGSGASYGVPFPIKRELTAKILGFKKVQNNSLYTQHTRGKFEAFVVFGLSQVMYDVSKFATDLLLFTTSEFNYFSVKDEFTTGSSLMPQKKNVDVAEILRAKFHTVNSNYFQINSISSNLPSGYNRDYQETKKPFIESINTTRTSLNIFLLLLKAIEPNKEVLNNAMSSDLFATHSALNMAKQGVPFRDAYGKVGNNLSRVSQIDFIQVMKDSTHIGAIGNLGIKGNLSRLNQQKKSLKKREHTFYTALEKLK
ncbi:MAG TPA: argininosuccinate lyase [Candidatus Levybacteria bacterium]|nr:argininosuccinate lyase [Candidatus Levybacteria bacterium]